MGGNWSWELNAVVLATSSIALPDVALWFSKLVSLLVVLEVAMEAQ